MQNPAAYNPVTEQVTVARQGNERENRITSSQTSVSAVARTGPHRARADRHASSSPASRSSRRRWPDSARGRTTDIYAPDIAAPVVGVDVVRTGAFSDGQASTAAVSVFDAVDIGSRLQVTGGLRVERYDASFLARDAAGVATTDVAVDDTLVSGKLGVLYKLTGQRQRLPRLRDDQDAAGHGQLHAVVAAEQPEQPNVDPQISTNLEVGSKWDFYGSRLSLTGAAFRTKNENVIFTVDATAVPPIFNQDDAQQVKGLSARRRRARDPQLGHHRQRRLPRLREPVAEPGQRRASG